MEITEIEKTIKACNKNIVSQTSKEESFDIIEGIVKIRSSRKKFDKVQWLRKEKEDDSLSSMFLDLIPDTFEDELAQFAITLFSYANKYNLNLQGLRLEESDSRNRSLEDVIYSIIKIEMSHYKRHKKIIIMTGILCSYCNDHNINLLWFVNKRLEFENSLN